MNRNRNFPVRIRRISSRAEPAQIGLRRRRCRSYSARSEEHTSELQSLIRISYYVFCLKKKKENKSHINAEKKQTSTRVKIKSHIRTQVSTKKRQHEIVMS